MKRTLTLFFFTFALINHGLAQQDSLTLIVSAEYRTEDSAKSFTIRIDFVSRKLQPITLYNRPLLQLICCNDFEQEIGVEIEKLDNYCYKPFSYCADCDPLYNFPKYEKESLKTLSNGETISYRDNISMFNRYRRNGKQIGFYGNYRCRAYWYYYEQGQRHKITSKWMFINFPDYK